jgi:outer membrane protein OmpA-like peptidoglycan-associated protein
MSDYDGLTPGQILADASVAEFISQLGLGIAQAQRALDENAIDQIAEFITPREGLGGRTLLDLGLSPAFYHYQHADISCSLQLSLRVQKDLSLGLNLSGSVNDTTTSDENRAENSSSTESGSETRTETRSASVEITAASVGVLTVGGQNFNLTGQDPLERMRNLQTALLANDGAGIGRALVSATPQTFAITTDADPASVQTGPNTIAFLAGGFDSAIIQVDANAATDFRISASASKTAATTAQATIDAYVAHVVERIEAAGYDAIAAAPGDPINSTFFDTGRHHITEALQPPNTRNRNIDARLMQLAQMIRARDLRVEIEGFADRQPFRGATAGGSAESNRRLGDLRAQAVRDRLVANGAPAGNITIRPSRGHEAAPATPVDNPDFRRASVFVVGRTQHWIRVDARSGGTGIDGVTPDLRTGPAAGNGFIFLFNPRPLNLAGKKVTIDGTDFPLSGAAVAPHAAGTPEAHARNLANSINANTGVTFTGSAEANVTTVMRKTQPFTLELITAEQRQISLSGTSGITVTRQFTRTESRSLTRQNTGNRAIAFGASLDVRYSRQFEMNVTGNSSITARLVSIPAPPEFLETIRAFLAPRDQP